MAINTSIQTLINSGKDLTNTDVVNMFYYFYGRQPTAAELQYWGDAGAKTSTQLSSAMIPNAGQFTSAGYYKDVIAQPTTTTPKFTREQLQDIFDSAQSMKNYSGMIQNQGDIDFLLQQLSGSNAATYAQRIQDEINRQAQTKQERSVPKFNSTGTEKYNWSTGGWESYTPPAGQVFDSNTKQWVQAPSTVAPPSAGGGGGTPAGKRIVYVWDGQKHNIYAVDEYNNYDYLSTQTNIAQKIKEGFTDTGNPGAGKSSTNLPTQLQTATQQQAPSGQTQTNGGGVLRNLSAEQEFVKNWGGRYGRLPTPDEVNQGVYGTPNPQFTTPQGTPPSGVAGQAEKQEPSPQLVLSINSIYKKYFNRDAKPDELAFWATRQLDELDRYLAIEYQTASGHSYDGSPITPGNLKSDKDLSYDEDTKRALSLIDDQVKAGTIPADIAQLFKAVIANYPKDAGFNTTELLNTFNKIKTETIDPHFKELTDLAIRDIQDTMTYFKEQERITLESEEASAAERIRQEQAGLEASGMTFTGEGIKQLGYGGLSKVGSAYAGTGIEGAIPQYNRLLAQSSAIERQKQYSQLGLQAESKLGTAGIAGLALPSYRVLGGITGEQIEQKSQDYGATLRNLISTTAMRNQGYSTQNLFS